MKPRLFDHIDFRVRDREIAQRFYAQLLPALGFRADKSGAKWGLFETDGGAPADFFGFTEDSTHTPNGNRTALWAESRARVDELAEVAREAGAQNIEGPALCLDYSPGYYAVFFEDPDGNKLEICHRESPTVAE